MLHVVGAYALIRQQVVNAGQGQVGLAQQCRAVRGQGASWVSVFKVCSPGWQKGWDHHKAEESAGGGRFFRFEVEIRRKGIKRSPFGDQEEERSGLAARECDRWRVLTAPSPDRLLAQCVSCLTHRWGPEESGHKKGPVGPCEDPPLRWRVPHCWSAGSDSGSAGPLR